LIKAPRRLLAALAVPLVAAAVAVTAGGTAHAAVKPSLPVSFAHNGATGSAGFDSAGNIALNLGNGTFAQVSVNLQTLGLSTAPATAPSFTTDKYAAGSPRWVIELANGNFITGYPAQLGAGAASDFSGAQWAVGTSGNYVTYQAALAGANDPLGNVKVTDAFIVEDADQAANTVDTLTGVQYDGLTAVPPPAQIVAVLSHGHVVSLNNNRAVLAWQVTPDKVNRFQVTMHVSGPLNNRTGITTIPQASYSGLPAGHTGYITVQALVPDASGKLVPSGKPGTIFFSTTRVVRPA
jgi:hypothetical protein